MQVLWASLLLVNPPPAAPFTLPPASSVGNLPAKGKQHHDTKPWHLLLAPMVFTHWACHCPYRPQQDRCLQVDYLSRQEQLSILHKDTGAAGPSGLGYRNAWGGSAPVWQCLPRLWRH